MVLPSKPVSFAKRRASKSPDAAPPAKRAPSPSLEEGELDDTEDSAPPLPPPPPSHVNLSSTSVLAGPSSLPPKPIVKSKVAFPFKTKKNDSNQASATVNSAALLSGSTPTSSSARGAYVRSNEDEWIGSSANEKNRQEHSRRGSSRRRDSPPRGNGRGYNSRSNSRSRSTSRSPTLHRLPDRRSPSRSYRRWSPEYGRYPQDRDRGRDGYYEDRDRERDRDRDRGRNRPYDRSYHTSDSREWTRRGDTYRPRYDSYRPSNHRSRSPTPPPPPRFSPPTSSTQPVDHARTPPFPPPQSPHSSNAPTFPPEPEPYPGDVPPQPKTPPPPAPPPDPRVKANGLPDRPALYIPLSSNSSSKAQPRAQPNLPAFQRLNAPADYHSPPSLRQIAHTDRDVHQDDKSRAPSMDPQRDPTRKSIPEPPPRIQLLSKRKNITRRTREEEKVAFGRVFEGCGVKADYEATTKLGEGTFGEVHKAIQKATNRVVALKRILMHNEKEGMPVTALREIKILKALKHDCIIDILDMFIVHSTHSEPMSVYMVFPYMDHDLAGLLENERVKLQPSQIKLYMKQLLEGTEYMHRNNILHRDMKAANLLISNSGSLRIADFGLARAFDAQEYKGLPYTTLDGQERRERKYTNCVVTRWYRPPELLLGARNYGGEVDIWGIGCVFGEMFHRRPILPGNSDIDQLDRIWALCGTPNQHTWPNYDQLPGCDGMKRFTTAISRKIKQTYESIGPETVDLLDQLLICNPQERITASQALEHDYFWTDPLPADPKTLPSYEASHELDRRSHHRQQEPPHGPPGPHAQAPPFNNPNLPFDRRNRPPPNPNRPHGQYHNNRNQYQPQPHGPPLHFSNGPGPGNTAMPPSGSLHGNKNFPPPPPPSSNHGLPPVPGGMHPNGYRPGQPYRDNRRRDPPRFHDNSLPIADSLPPRPPVPLGTSADRGDRGGRGGAGYGNERGPSSSSGNDSLNYG
ncbi:kinase-like domain-containing protein [Lentinula raphanica]|uniref:Kinase-like domain-containing protein n=1 Tax=Lentinula raphanica TaxID=153919 RepID=A0AA38UI41_9AGAR|nr:kinase-like domain-containing protein [Lentinula raphanica]